MVKEKKFRHIFLLLVLVTLASESFAQPSKEFLQQKAAMIHQRVLTIDTHIDWPSRQLRSPEFVPGERHEPGSRASGQWDLMRMQEGGLDAVFMSIYTSQGPRTDEGHANAQAHALELIEITKKMVSDYPNLAEIALTPEDAVRLEKSGKRAIFMGMENGYPIGKDLSLIKTFYDLGVRYMTITHTRNNELGDSSTDEKTEWNGLSPLGEAAVKEMNRLGMMVDISHVHDETFWDVIALTQAPVIASHSSARALCDHPRNMNDDMLAAVKKNGGVVQLCLLGNYIKKLPPNPEREAALEPYREKRAAWRRGELSEDEQSELMAKFQEINEKFPANRPHLTDAIDHIDHMVKVMGIDHIGIGSDFDGGGGFTGIDDVSEMPNITLELLRRGYSEKDIRKIWGGNLLRVFKDTEKVAQKLQKQQPTLNTAN